MNEEPNRVPEVEVLHTPDTNRFIIPADNEHDVSQLRYEMRDGTMRIMSVVVPPKYRNHGYASQLTKTALEYAKMHRMYIVPVCPFVQWYLRENPAYEALLQPRG